MTDKKYEFTGETKEVGGPVLKRIRLLRDIGGFKSGDVGGWIESEDNLSHEGNCWVYESARVFGEACVSGEALVSGAARVSGSACVFGVAWEIGRASCRERVSDYV